MENDFIQLSCFINAWDAYNEDYREQSRAQFRQFLTDMADKGPDHLVGVFRMYVKTHQIEDASFNAFEPLRFQDPR
jgi:hypothetical protein